MGLIETEDFRRKLVEVQTNAEHFDNTDRRNDIGAIIALLDAQPIAYDVDKVVAAIEEKLKELEEISGNMVLNKERKAINRGYYIAMNHAIDIIRNGGKKEE